MSETKFCKDCKFLESSEIELFDNAYAKCYHPSAFIEPDNTAKSIYLVNGKRSPAEYYYAATLRGIYGQCGKDAKFFEPKEAVSEKTKPKFFENFFGIIGLK